MFDAVSLLSLFQHTAARRRLVGISAGFCAEVTVSTHSRPKAAGERHAARFHTRRRFNTQPPEGGWVFPCGHFEGGFVSTHSRPKAAGRGVLLYRRAHPRFNTQPPEGGWI